MPTYDYRCDLCQEQFELWQSFSEDTLVTCPVEGGPPACRAPGEGPVKKVFSKVGISFKGDGFYKNDHGANASRRKEKKELSESGAGSDSSSKSGGEGSRSSGTAGSSGSDSSPASGGEGSGSSGSTATSKPSSSDKVTN